MRAQVMRSWRGCNSKGVDAIQQMRHLGFGSRRQPVAAQHVQAAGRKVQILGYG